MQGCVWAAVTGRPACQSGLLGLTERFLGLSGPQNPVALLESPGFSCRPLGKSLSAVEAPGDPPDASPGTQRCRPRDTCAPVGGGDKPCLLSAPLGPGVVSLCLPGLCSHTPARLGLTSLPRVRRRGRGDPGRHTLPPGGGHSPQGVAASGTMCPALTRNCVRRHRICRTLLEIF